MCIADTIDELTDKLSHISFLAYAAGCGTALLVLLLTVRALENVRETYGEFSQHFVNGGYSKRLRFAYPAMSGLLGGQTGERCDFRRCMGSALAHNRVHCARF